MYVCVNKPLEYIEQKLIEMQKELNLVRKKMETFLTSIESPNINPKQDM
jgi:hypothetical protein